VIFIKGFVDNLPPNDYLSGNYSLLLLSCSQPLEIIKKYYAILYNKYFLKATDYT
jgi:hypothetical protein